MDTYKYSGIGCDGAPQGVSSITEKYLDPHSCKSAHSYHIKLAGEDSPLLQGFLVLCERCAELAKKRGWKIEAKARFIEFRAGLIK